jgi:hypothetical protein
MVSHGYMCPDGQYTWINTIEYQRIRDQDTIHEIHISGTTKHNKENTTAQNIPFYMVLNYSKIIFMYKIILTRSIYLFK